MSVEHERGYVYLVRRGDGLLKIGRSRHVEQRIKELNRYEPKGFFTLLHTIATNRAELLEHGLHQRFAEFHVRGEWFVLPTTELKVLQGVSSVQFTLNMTATPWTPGDTPCICRDRWKGWLGTTPRGRRPKRPPEEGTPDASADR